MKSVSPNDEKGETMLFQDKPNIFVPATIPVTATTIFKDINYAPDARHTLDVYLPDGHQDFPVIVDIYGGGLLRGQKSSAKLNPSLRFLADQFAIISINYRLNDPLTNQFPNQIADIRAALDFLSLNATQYRLDMTDLTLIGESSGAQLAVLAAATFTKQHTIGNIPNVTFNPTFPMIKHVIALYGPYQLDQFNHQFKKLGITPKFSETGTAKSFEGIMLQHQSPKDVPDLVSQANPATYFTNNMPPLMLIAGKKDSVVPYLQSVQLAETYRAIVGDSIETHWLPYGVHGPKDYNNEAIHTQKLAFITQN